MGKKIDEKREFLRHRLDIPVVVKIENLAVSKDEYLINISASGLCFRAKEALESGAKIEIRIPLIKPIFEAEGNVVWCKKRSGFFEIGVKFVQDVDLFRMRMIEQVCHIEKYKQEVFKNEGRVLSGTEAALEWINKFADKFPRENENKGFPVHTK